MYKALLIGGGGMDFRVKALKAESLTSAGVLVALRPPIDVRVSSCDGSADVVGWVRCADCAFCPAALERDGSPKGALKNSGLPEDAW